MATTAPEWTAEFTAEQIGTYIESTQAQYTARCADRDAALMHLGNDSSLWTTRDRAEIARWASFIDSIARDYRDLVRARDALAAA